MTKALTITADTLAVADHTPVERWDAAVSRYLETRRGGPGGNTAKTYGRTLREYSRFAAGYGLSPWAGDAIIAYNRWVNGLDVSNDTKHHKLGHVQAFLSWAHGYGATPLTPAMVKDLLDKPPVKELSPKDLLTIEEMSAILEAVEDPLTRAAIRVMGNAGLRISEAVGIRAEHIYDYEGRWYVHVPSELAKSRRARSIPIDQDLADELLALEVADDLPLIRLDPSTVWRRIQALVKRAGVDKNVSPHTFRHTCANRWRLLGVPLEVVGHWLGHASLDTTTRYTRPAELAMMQDAPTMPWDVAR
jgi:integrase/recombinase XerD